MRAGGPSPHTGERVSLHSGTAAAMKLTPRATREFVNDSTVDVISVRPMTAHQEVCVVAKNAWAVASVALALVIATLTPRVIHAQVTYVRDPLTSAPTAGAAPGVVAGARGGSFGTAGWTTTGDQDTIWFSIPAAIPRGRVEFNAVGLGIMTSLRGQEHDILAIYGATDRAEPVMYNPWYRNNQFKVLVRIFGAMNSCSGCQAVGASKLELAFCPAGGVGYNEGACPGSCVAAGYDFWQAYLGRGRDDGVAWDPAVNYRFVVGWEPGRMSYTRGVEGTSTLTFPGTYAPAALRVRIGSPSSERGPDTAMPRGVTFSNLLVVGEPGAATPSCTGTPMVDAGPPPPDVDPPPMGTVIDLPAVEDVTVDMTHHTSVYPDVNDLAVGAGDAEFYLKFRVGPLMGRVVRAQLLLNSGMNPSSEGSGASVSEAANSDWSESTLMWNARPGPRGARLARADGISANRPYAFELPRDTVSAAGTWSFVVSPEPGDTNAAHFDSKEVSPSRGPILRLTIDTSMPLPDAGVMTPDVPTSMDVASVRDVPSVDVDAAQSDAGPPLSEVGSDAADDRDGLNVGCGCRAEKRGARGLDGLALAAISLAWASLRRRRAA